MLRLYVNNRSHDSVVGFVTMLRVGMPMNYGSLLCRSKRSFFFYLFQNFRTGFRAHSASYHWVTGSLFPWGYMPGRKADDSHLSDAEVKNEWSCTCVSAYVFSWRLQ